MRCRRQKTSLWMNRSIRIYSQEGKSRESSGQLLGCSRIFILYFIVYLAVHSRREIDMAVFEVPL